MKEKDPKQLLSYEIDEDNETRSYKMPLTFGLMALAVVAMGGWYFFYGLESEDPNKPIPLIKATDYPTKELPDSSAQPEVPHQDKLVYSRINPEEKGNAVESILTEFEEPIDPQEINEDTAESEKPSEPQQPLESGLNELKTEEENNEQEPAESPVTESIVVVEEPKKEPAVESKATEEVEEKKEPATENEEVIVIDSDKQKNVEDNTLQQPASGEPMEKAQKLKSGYRVQVAALKSPESAKKEWARLQKEYAGVLGQLNPHYARVDLGVKKGIFYRVQAGDFEGKAAAEKVCQQMKSKKVDCLVVRF